MGLTLVTLGIVLFLAKFNETFSISWLFKFWPLILVILGLEMVLLNVLTLLKGSRLRFTYDILSVFLVLFLLFVSSALVVIESTGAADIAHRALWISERYIESEKVLYTADESLKAISLNIESSRKTSLRTYEGNEIKVSVVYKGHFVSQDEGKKYAEDQYLRVERLGNMLLIDINPPGRGSLPHSFVEQEVTVFIPQHLDVDVKQAKGDIQAVLNDIKSNWIIHLQGSYRTLDILLDDVTDAKMSVDISDGGLLRGNIVWNPDFDDKSQDDSIVAVKTWGTGKYSLAIYQSGGTTAVNTR